MGSSPPSLQLATSGQEAVLRLTGKPTLDVSNQLRSVAERLLASGCQRFTVDLAGCPSVDSTFIGVLIHLAKLVRRAAAEAAPVCLLNAGDLVRRQIDTLGVLDRFELAAVGPAGVRFESVPVAAVSKAEATRLSLEAHRALIEACAANAVRFQDVVEFLEADLQRANPGPPSSPAP